MRGKPHFGTYLRRCGGTHRAREALPPRLRGPPEPRGTARAPPGGAGCGRRAHGSVPGRFGAVLLCSSGANRATQIKVKILALTDGTGCACLHFLLCALRKKIPLTSSMERQIFGHSGTLKLLAPLYVHNGGRNERFPVRQRRTKLHVGSHLDDKVEWTVS